MKEKEKKGEEGEEGREYLNQTNYPLSSFLQEKKILK